MLSSLLVETNQIISYVVLGVLVVLIVVMFVFSYRRRKKQDQEAKDLIDSVQPGNKVKTIGGICGIVVSVDPEESTFVLETGSEEHGKCYIKFDRQAIFQTDAKIPGKEEKKEKTEVAPAEETKEEVKEEVKEEKVELTKTAEPEENKENK